MIRPAELIQRKRDGQELGGEELSELVLAYARGDVPDYQLAAFCMAVYFQGLTTAETFALTDAMVRSGDTIDLGAALGRRVVDKHSTGGVGDKTTIALAPLAAAMGMPVAKLSGRGLAHTGGTLDKLEAIPGFRVGLSVEELIAQVGRIGCALAAVTILFLKQASQDLELTGGPIQIIVCEFAPPPFGLASHLFPFAFQNIFVHRFLLRLFRVVARILTCVRDTKILCDAVHSLGWTAAINAVHELILQ